MTIRDAIARAVSETICVERDELPWKTPLYAFTDSLDRIEMRHKVAGSLACHEDDLEPLLNDVLTLEAAADLIEQAVNDRDAASLSW